MMCKARFVYINFRAKLQRKWEDKIWNCFEVEREGSKRRLPDDAYTNEIGKCMY
jgi:hypothetical protein